MTTCTAERIEDPTLPHDSYDSLEDLMAALNSWGRGKGLAFVLEKTNNFMDGKPTYATIACDRGGRCRPSAATIRQTSPLTNCK